MCVEGGGGGGTQYISMDRQWRIKRGSGGSLEPISYENEIIRSQ